MLELIEFILDVSMGLMVFAARTIAFILIFCGFIAAFLTFHYFTARTDHPSPVPCVEGRP